jgi:hypothetical protein
MPTEGIYRTEGPVTVTAFPLELDVPVTPPREVRATDITKLTVPMPFMLTIIGLVVTIAIGVLSIKGDVRLIDERITHEKELRLETERRRDEQFKTLEAKIESAGLRNFNAVIASELAKEKERK